MEDMDEPRSDRLLRRSRLALALGFGSVLIIMAIAGMDALRVLHDFHQNDDAIRRRFLAQNHVLNDIRSQVYLSGTYIRDYLLEPETSSAENYRTSLEQVHREMNAALEAYGRDLPRAETAHYTALRDELTQYWGILDPMFRWNPAERRALGYAFLRDQVFPRRQNMLTIADRIAAINEQQLNAGNDELAALLRRFQTRFAITLFTALAVGLVMAVFSIRRILRVESEAHSRYLEALDARRQLTDLSARLVQAQETERRSLSRELHDEVGQSLSAVLVELRNLSTGLAARSEDQWRNQVETIKGLVEATIRVVRNMALLLRPSMLDDLGLVPALKWQAREVSKRTSMDVTVAADLQEPDLPDEYNTCIYRVVQEALHNCSSHARASSVRIRVQQKTDRLTLSIQDDGQGFDSRHVKGLGLLGIQERVARLGGTSQVRSAPGKGTVLNIELPIHTEEAHDRNEDIREIDSHPVSG
jgi:signal transduction histidine kinase